jgi:hypothetical protein
VTARAVVATTVTREIVRGDALRSYWALGIGLLLLALLLCAVPFLTSGSGIWLGLDWIDGRKLFSIDDAYRYFVAKNAFELKTVFLWNYTLPLALLFDSALAGALDGDLLLMRLGHAALGVATLALVARASLKAACGPVLSLASIAIIGLMPLFLVVSSSFYGEGLFALLLALAFVLLIEEKLTPLAVVVGLSPLVRFDGAIYCVLFLAYFAMRRDATRCALVALPGLAYLAAVFAFSPDWQSALSWRLELREILAPLDLGDSQSISVDRLLNPVWGGLALAALFMRRWRRWWPILAGPIVVIAVQAIGILRGVQDYEPRYYFSLLPVFGVAWALPIRSLLDAQAGRPLRGKLVVAGAGLVFLAATVVHSFQSDWLRQYATGQWPRQSVSRELGDKALLFDPTPLRAFAGRVDAFVAARDNVRTVFVADYAPLYFLSLEERELVLIPHDPSVATYSGGYYFGFSLEQLGHRYYRFEAAQDGPAVLIVDDGSRTGVFAPESGEPNGAGSAAGPVAANVQSGTLKAFSVLPASRDEVVWSIPRRVAR